jgi:endonuclease/exonuclease/phosphatase family metal-dependent hydrolase
LKRAALCLLLIAAFLACDVWREAPAPGSAPEGVAAAGAAPAAPAPGAAADLRVTWWNIENLFDADDDPANPGDDEFTPVSWRRWTEALYRLKLRRLAEVAADLHSDILCVAEVENRRVVEDLAAVLRRDYGLSYPHIIHRESRDERGIDVAILANIEPVQTDWLSPVPGQRDVVVATFRRHGADLTVIANHWKSRWDGAAQSAPLRRTEARAVRAAVDRLLARDPRAAVLVAGDFNDDIDDASLAVELRSTTNLAAVVAQPDAGWLYNLHGGLPAALRGTIYYRAKRTWNTFDSINVSSALMTGAGRWRVRPASYAIYRPAKMLTDEGLPKAFRRFKNRATGRWEYQIGYSDHLPISVTVENRTPNT